MADRHFVAGRMSEQAARTSARLAHSQKSHNLSAPKSLLEMEALGLRKALKALFRHRASEQRPFGNLHSWVSVAADIAAALYANVGPTHVAACCVSIGLPIDDQLIAAVTRRVAAARRAEGDRFKLMSADAVGKAVELSSLEREGLGITKIGAIDESAKERRRRLDRERKREARAERGLKPRAALPETKPWEALGVSRSGYYARKRNPGLNVGFSLYSGKADIQSKIRGKADAKSRSDADFQSSLHGHSGKADIQSKIRGKADKLSGLSSASIVAPPKGRTSAKSVKPIGDKEA